jgi:hypothetical protein
MLLRCFHADDLGKAWNERLSRGPRNREEFNAATEFILGHFTTSAFLPSILKDGLQPDVRKERAMDDNLLSDNRSVYLATTFDRFYLDRAPKFHGGAGIIIEARVPRSDLSADEEWLNAHEQATLDRDEALYRSMCGGACKHAGPISLDRILSITATDGTIIWGSERA